MIPFAMLLLAAADPLASPQPAKPVFMFETGATLLKKCDNKSPEYALACTAYIVGAIDGIRKDIFIGRTQANCWPGEIGAEKARGVVIAYLRKYPDQRSMPASVIVSIAMNDAYSCSQ
ncbi:Rap1a/Tai family immunity protein [Sphingobium sp. H39-3-25]|uniref:Rap1a/Tai family immunity protein n=1 Tax=Sphingobium arseniciresistens TaxID=3030834 RepID=UPI0023B8B42E|nr:Rap1a/Tai family immunity protein [Sphingobium arseniciresistens]